MYIKCQVCMEPTSSSATSSFFFCLHLRAWNLFLPFLRIFPNIVQCWNKMEHSSLICCHHLQHSCCSTLSSWMMFPKVAMEE